MKFQLIASNLTLALFCLISISNTSAQIRKSNTNLGDKFQQLQEMSNKKSVLRFNGQKFKEFVKNGPRNYSVVTMFTALAPQRSCQICHHASDEFQIVANSYRYLMYQSTKIFFITVDFDEGSDVFHMLRLNTAPIFMHFPAKSKVKSADTLDIQRVGYSAEALAKWIFERTDVEIRIFRPPNYTGSVALILMFIVVTGILYLRRDYLDFLYNKVLWGISAVGFCFLMISGQMWNHIRGPPLFHKTQNGVSYFHGSSQGQFIVETYIVLLLNAAIVIGMILISEAATRKMDIGVRRIIAISGLGMVTLFFSVILSVFKSKAHGYPYSFLIK